MYFRRIVILLSVLLLVALPVAAQDDSTTLVEFEEGSVIVLPAGWDIIFEPDAYGNFMTSRSDGFSANISFIPLASIGEAFSQIGIDPDNAIHELLDFYLAQNDMATAGGEAEIMNIGEAEVIVFTMTEDDGSGRIYVGQFPNSQILLVTLGFDADVSLDDEAVQQVFADVEFIYENVQPAVADDSADMDDADMSDEGEDARYTTEIGISYVPPAEWELSSENYDPNTGYSADFSGDMGYISVEIPVMSSLEQGMEQLGIGYDELAATIFEINRGSEYDEVEFDADSIIADSFDGGTFETYIVENENGDAQLMVMAILEDGNAILIDVRSTSDKVNDYYAPIMVMLNSIESSGTAEEPADSDDSSDSADDDTSLLTLGDGTAFSVPDGWFVDNITSQNTVQMLIGDEDQARVDLPSLADIEQGLEGLGVDLEGLASAIIEMQSNSYEFEFDASMIETTDVERGTLYTYSALDDEGIYVAWYIMIYDDGHVGGVEYSSYDELGTEVEESALYLLNSVQFPE